MSATPRWRRVRVGNSTVELMEAGSGEPLLFLHGWGLTPRSYGDALVRLCAGGLRVIAPSLPGFGKSSPLPVGSGIRAYADEIGRLLDVLELESPVFLVGHSFGGGVALQLAHDHPGQVRSLTLVNTVGGRPAKGTGMLDGGRLAWLRWMAGAVGELDPREWMAPHVAPQVLRDYFGNAFRHPLRMTTSALLALRASLTVEATALVESGLPVLFLWGDRDRLILPGEFAGLGDSLGPEVVAGRHGWMLTEPAEFAGVLRDALVVHAMLERKRRKQPAPASLSGNVAALFPQERRKRERWSPE